METIADNNPRQYYLNILTDKLAAERRYRGGDEAYLVFMPTNNPDLINYDFGGSLQDVIGVTHELRHDQGLALAITMAFARTKYQEYKYIQVQYWSLLLGRRFYFMGTLWTETVLECGEDEMAKQLFGVIYSEAAETLKESKWNGGQDDPSTLTPE